ncbi:MAG: response regulator, partial [Myxococcota bacterium]|nr:response regulator [Myxococcota bacterium]
MADPHQALKEKFRSITFERLTGVSNAVLRLREDPSNQLVFDDLKRDLHTQKGEARMLGFVELSRIAHFCESLLLVAKEDGFDGESVAIIFNGLDQMEGQFDEQADADAVQHFYDAASTLLRQRNQVIPEQPTAATAPKKTVPSPAGQRRPRSAAFAKAEAPVTAPSSDAPPSAPTTVKVASTIPVTGTSTAGPARAPVSGDAAATALKRIQALTRDDSVRVELKALDKITEFSSDLLLGLGQVDLELEELQHLLEDWRGAIRTLEEAAVTFSAVSQHSPERVADLIRLVANSARQMGRMAGRAVMLPTRFRDFVFEQKMGIESIENSIRDVRLVPLASLLDSIPRAANDLSRELGKQVRVELSGHDVGLDKHVLDRIAEPLLHLLRNAIDHGIESPQERQAAGKAAEGLLRVSARQLGGHVELCIQDDGRGLNARDIVGKLRGEGYASKLAAHDLMDEALEAIFSAGFSTRDEVSEFSGRGVGLDVVKRRVEGLGGMVSVHSEAGYGMRVSCAVPISVAVVQVLVLRLEGHAYAVPVTYVQTVFMAKREQVERAGLGTAIEVNETMVPLLNLRDALGLQGPSILGEEFWVLVLSHQGGALAFAVDQVVEVVRVLQRAVDGFLTGIEVLSGTSILEGGQVALLLNVPALFRGAHGMAKPVFLEGNVRRSFDVLVVDDSEIAREVVREVLLQRGYVVREAINGKEALREIEQRRPRLVVTDLEMPVMDGFELLRSLRAAKATRELPVIVLTSRG